MFSYFKELNDLAIETELTEEFITMNIIFLNEQFNIQEETLIESAATTLARIALRLQSDNKDQINVKDTAALIVGLRAVSDSDVRSALGMSDQHLGLVAAMTGKNPRISDRLTKIGNHDSFASLRSSTEQQLTSAIRGDDNSIIQDINKLRMEYERFLTKSSGSNQKATA